MIRAYSQRLLPPYSGVVQIVDSAAARAQSFDGVNWEIHFLSGSDRAKGGREREPGYALDRGYYNVASLRNQDLKTYVFPAFLNPAEVTDCISELVAFLDTAKAPFPPADGFEYWLLDGADETPLALIFSCCTESQMGAFPSTAGWTAMPHSKLKVENTAGEVARGEGPVNDRFQRLVARRAGSNPRAAWFRRGEEEGATFPALLVREDWRNPEDRDLCQRYLMRMAPRLLMLPGLDEADRDRLEEAGRQYAIEVDECFPLYPDVVDSKRMAAIRVEARLRRNMPVEPAASNRGAKDVVTELGKDQRIFET